MKMDSEKMPLNLAILGGGTSCKAILHFLEKHPLAFVDVNVLGVCDINPRAEGLLYAKEKGIFTTQRVDDLLNIKDIHALVELTSDRNALIQLIQLKPKGIGVLDHNIGRLLTGLLRIDHKLKSIETQVASAKAAQDFLIHQSDERIVLLNPDFSIIDANEPYLNAVRKTREEVIGAHCYEITHGLSAPCSVSQPGLGCPMVETLRTGTSAQVIHEHPISENTSMYCDMVTYPLKNRRGEILQVIEIWRDITEELSSRWERRIRAMKDDLKKLVQEDRLMSLGKLVASSVHEINNPVQGLLTFSRLMEEMLAEGDPDARDLEKFRRFLPIMSRELERCGTIISGLLSFSRQSGNQFTHMDLNDVLQEVLTLTRHKMELQNVALRVTRHPAPLPIHGDVNQIQQCFLNLIFNALEAMPGGGTLSLATELDATDKRAIFSISDTGCGIGEADLDHIFDPFFTTKEPGEGTGLGLSITHGIIKSHGGKIHIQSRRGTGTTFTLSIPIQNGATSDRGGSRG